jgi:hypothetical protein
MMQRGSFNALARGGAGRNRFVTGSDTPFGKYVIKAVQFGRPISRSYGTGKVFMEPVSGEAKDSGRTLLRIHGGGNSRKLPDPFAPYQELIATDGCVRVANADAEAISSMLKEMGIDDDDFVYVGSADYLKKLSWVDSNLWVALQKENTSVFDQQIRNGFERLLNELNLRRLQEEGRGTAESKLCLGTVCR